MEKYTKEEVEKFVDHDGKVMGEYLKDTILDTFDEGIVSDSRLRLAACPSTNSLVLRLDAPYIISISATVQLPGTDQPEMYLEYLKELQKTEAAPQHTARK